MLKFKTKLGLFVAQRPMHKSGGALRRPPHRPLWGWGWREPRSHYCTSVPSYITYVYTS